MNPVALPSLRSAARSSGRRRRLVDLPCCGPLSSSSRRLLSVKTRSSNHAPSTPPPKSRIRSRPTTTSAFAFNNEAAAEATASAASRDGIKKCNKNILPLSLVNSPSVKLALPLLGNISYVALASGFLMTDMLTLRLALVGGYTGLVAFHSLHPRPLRIPLGWSGLFVLVNATAVAYLLADEFPGVLSDEESKLYEEHFKMLTKGQFKQLVDLGKTRTLPSGYRLTIEGVHSDTIYFTKRGHSKLYLRGRYAKDIEEGSFVNDVAFHLVGSDKGENEEDEEGAYGTVVTDGEVEVIEWNWRELRSHLGGRPEMDRNVQLCLTSHLVKGLLQQRKAAYKDDYSDDNRVLGIETEDF